MDPAAQVEQIDVDDAEYVPLSQAVHEVAPLDTIPLPAPISAIDPAAQVEQAEFDATVLYVLTEHAVQQGFASMSPSLVNPGRHTQADLLCEPLTPFVLLFVGSLYYRTDTLYCHSSYTKFNSFFSFFDRQPYFDSFWIVPQLLPRGKSFIFAGVNGFVLFLYFHSTVVFSLVLLFL